MAGEGQWTHYCAFAAGQSKPHQHEPHCLRGPPRALYTEGPACMSMCASKCGPDGLRMYGGSNMLIDASDGRAIVYCVGSGFPVGQPALKH